MAEIKGTDASETLVGTGDDDLLAGAGGDDVLRGSAGQDDLDGGADQDDLFGGMGDDALVGGEGDDRLYGEGGDDALTGGAGSDQLFGGAGDDVVHGGDGDDYIVSDETSSDVLHGDGGDDQIYLSRLSLNGPSSSLVSGGAGNDYLFIQSRQTHEVAIDAGEGDDRLFIAELYTSAAVTLGAGRDHVDLGSFDFYARNGGRLIIADFAAGATGDLISLDTLLASYSSWNAALNPFASGHLKVEQSGADAVLYGRSSPATNGAWVPLVTFQNLSAAALTAHNLGGYAPDGSVSATSVTGSDAAELLAGGAGNDVIDGLGGFNRIYGGAGDDALTGGDAVDWLVGGVGNDVLTGGGGNDSLVGGDGDDLLLGGIGNDSLSAGASGTDQLFGDDGDDSLSLTRAATAVATSLIAHGGDGNDAITLNLANAASATVSGGAGNDLVAVSALNGAATLSLGAGQDRINLLFSSVANGNGTFTVTDFATGSGGDRIELQAYFSRFLTGWNAATNPFLTGFARLIQNGDDTLLQIDRNGGGDAYLLLATFQGTDAATFIDFNLGGYSPDGSASPPLDLDGSAGTDFLLGSDAGDLIEGQDGNDRLIGHGGNDQLYGGEGDDTIEGGTGDDLAEGGGGRDLLLGGAGNDILAGGADDDTLSETVSGNDQLSGGDGSDSITVTRTAGSDQVAVSGDGGRDYVRISANATTVVTVDAGEGDDEVELLGTGAATITLGAGRDTLDLNGFAPAVGSTVAITDFAAGDEGDTIDLDHRLATSISVADPNLNPFATGFLRLVQSGADAILQYDYDGAGTAGSFVNWLTLRNVDIFTLTAANFDGFQPNVIAGTAADEVFVGTTGDDLIKGFGGRDVFHIGYGGADTAIGGSGDDTFVVHLVGGLLAHKVEGGDGDDLLVLEGYQYPYVPISIGGTTGDRIEATGIEGLRFLSFVDQEHSPGPFAPRAYYVRLEDNIAAAGTGFLVDATPLSNLETLRFVTTDADAFLDIRGGAGDDDLSAGGGGSRIDGNNGDDDLRGGVGDDALSGGIGDDRIEEHSGAVALDTISGGEGSDYIEIYRTSVTDWGRIEAHGDDGDDTFEVVISKPGVAILDGGAGNDRFKMEGALTGTTVTLGAGADFYDIYVPSLFEGQGNVITDFDPDEDTIGIILQGYLPGYPASGNPFGSGHLRIVASGDDVLIQADRLLQGSWATLLRLENLTLVEMQNASIGGWMIHPVFGTEGDDEIVGTPHGDMIFAGGGNDVVRLNQAVGGVDKAIGGEGDDIFVLGAWLNDKDEIDGGAGNDTVLVHGFSPASIFSPGPTILGAKSLLGIETLRMLSGSDTSYGSPGNLNFGYRVTSADANVAAGATLLVDMSQLGVNEGVSFNGAAELDGRFVMRGGAGSDVLTGGAGHDDIEGGDGNDILTGGAGVDDLDGGEGADTLAGGAGSDSVSGGGGDDVINETGSGSDILSGGEGNDQFALTRTTFSTDVLSAAGGAGADRFTVTMSGSTLTIDAGEGDDLVTLVRSFNVKVTLGAGADTLNLAQLVRTGGIAEILDFQPGAGGDMLAWGSFNSNLWSWSPGLGDPFQKGYARLAQKGADVHLQVNASGNGGLSSPYETILIFKNADKSGFTAANLGGYGPLSLTGTEASETLTGSQGDDVITGAGGNDLFLIQQGGTDAMAGGAGDDSFFFGGRFPQSWQATGLAGPMIDGGAGSDTIIIQGFGFNGWPVPTTGIEGITFLSGTDNRYGTAGAKLTFGTSVTLLDADIVGMPLFTIDAGGLLVGERVTIDLRAESDVDLLLVGGAGDDLFTPGRGTATVHAGAGNDYLDGGYGGDNSFHGGAGNDRFYGGWGDNFVDGGDGDDLLEEVYLRNDSLNGGAGNDVIRLRGNGTEQLSNVSAAGGDGDDSIELDTNYPGVVAIDGGAGADTINITGARGAITIALGAGQDVFTLNNMQWVIRADTTLTITDFTPGDAGDRFNWSPLLASGLTNFAAGSNPFTTGHARVIESGADSLLQIDRDGSGAAGFVTYVTLAGVDSSSLTAFNLGFALSNNPPAGSDATRTLNEDGSYVFAASDFGFRDASDGDAMLAVKITTLPTAGTLWIDGVATTAGQTIGLAAIAANGLVFVPVANASGTASFTFQVQDDGGIAGGGSDLDPSANRFNFTIEAVNDAPAGADATRSIGEDQSYTFATADFGFADAADGHALLGVKIATLPTSGSLLLDNVAVSASEVVSAADIAAGLLRFVPAANGNGAAYSGFDFQVQDDGGTTRGGTDVDPISNRFTFNVDAVNDAPTVTIALGLTATEQVPLDFKTAFSVADVDIGSGSFSIDIFADEGVFDATLSGGGIIIAGIGSTGVRITATAAELAAFLADPTQIFTFTLGDDTPAASVGFSITAYDNGGTGSGGNRETTAYGSIAIAAADDAPVAAGDAATVAEDAIQSGNLFADNGSGPDNDVDGGPMTIIEINGQAYTPGEQIILTSGAKLIVGADGSYSYDPDGAEFDLLISEEKAAATGAGNTSKVDSFTYTLAGGSTATVTLTVTGVDGPGDWVGGGAGDDALTGTSGVDFFLLHDGGADSVDGGAGNDFLYFGASFGLEDSVDAGTGRSDRLALLGDYEMVFDADSLVGIDRLLLYTAPDEEHDYDLTTIDANVEAGAQLEIAALSLKANESLSFDGSAESDGWFWFRAGAGDDVLIGGDLGDRFVGGLGADRMAGNGGADRFEVANVTHSTGAGFDILVGFDASADRINIAGVVSGWGESQSGELNEAGFDDALAALVDETLGINGAVRVTASSGDHAGRIFVIVDADGNGIYQAGSDYVFAFEGAAQENLEAYGFFV